MGSQHTTIIYICRVHTHNEGNKQKLGQDMPDELKIKKMVSGNLKIRACKYMQKCMFLPSLIIVAMVDR